MAEGDGTAVHIDLGGVQVKFLDYSESLGRECFIQFEQINILKVCLLYTSDAADE